MQPTVHEIIEYAEQIDLLVKIIGKVERLETVKITGLNRFEKAIPRELSWLSNNKVNVTPESENFSGTILILPVQDFFKQKPDAIFITCKNPKLLFCKIAKKFFHKLTETRWPGNSGNGIYKNTLIGKNVQIGRGAVIGSNVSIGDNVKIGPNTVIANCKIGNDTTIGSNCSIGLPGFGFVKDDDKGNYLRFPHIGGVVLEDSVEIGSNTCIDRGSLEDTVVGKYSKIDNLVHIAHNVSIGENTLIIANSMVGGSVHIGPNVWIAPSVSIMNQVSVGSFATLGLGTVVLKSVAESSVMVGNPSRLLKKNMVK